MPTYDYQCDACGHTFELYQGINDSKKRKCPKCNKLKLRRLLGTGAAIVFKGSGFYQTDYRSESYKKAAAAEKTSPDSGAASTGKAGDSSKGTEAGKSPDKKPSGKSKKSSS
jgi:putative FmdB family regulatory protein